MKKSNAFKYIFIIVTLILATITFLIYDKDKKQQKVNQQLKK